MCIRSKLKRTLQKTWLILIIQNHYNKYPWSQPILFNLDHWTLTQWEQLSPMVTKSNDILMQQGEDAYLMGAASPITVCS